MFHSRLILLLLFRLFFFPQFSGWIHCFSLWNIPKYWQFSKCCFQITCQINNQIIDLLLQILCVCNNASTVTCGQLAGSVLAASTSSAALSLPFSLVYDFTAHLLSHFWVEYGASTVAKDGFVLHIEHKSRAEELPVTARTQFSQLMPLCHTVITHVPRL